MKNTYAVTQIYDDGGKVGMKRFEKFADPLNQDGPEQKLSNDYNRANVWVYKFDQDFNESRNQGDGTLEGVTYKITRTNKDEWSQDFTPQIIKTEWDSEKNAYIAKTKPEKHGYGEKDSGPIIHGDYVIEEIDPSTGYANGKFRKEFTYNGKDGETFVYDDKNPNFPASKNPIYRGGIKFPKLNFDTKDNMEGDIQLDGIRFAFINKSKANIFVENKEYKPGEVVAIHATDKDGVLETENNLLPYGTYDVVELRRDSKVKVGDVYETADKGKSEYASPKQDSVLWAENLKSFQIREDKKVIDGKEMENKPSRGDGMIQKRDLDIQDVQGDASFEGIQYSIVNASKYKTFYNGTLYEPGVVMDILVTDKDGKVKSDKMPYGTYTIHELRRDNKVEIGKDFESQDKGTSIYANDKGYLYKEFTETKPIHKNGEVIEFTNANPVVRGGVAIEKRDRETKGRTPLGQASFLGIEFEITNRSKMPVMVDNKVYKPGEVVMTIKALEEKDEDGQIHYVARTSDNALPYGRYEIKETSLGTSTGYLYDQESKDFIREFSIGYEKEGYQYFTTEHKEMLDLFGAEHGIMNQVIREDFHFIKKDEDSMERMANIVFLLTSKTTGEKHILVTDENGEFNSSAWQTNETKGIPHTFKTNVNDPDSPISNGAIVKDKDGNYKVVKPELLEPKTGVWFTGLSPEKTKWAKDGKSYEVDGVNVPVRDDLRAFPYDTYELKELRSKDNEGYKLITATVTLHEYGDHDGKGIDIDYGTLDNKPVYVATELLSKETGEHIAPISEKTNYVDKLSYMNLDRNKEYKTIAELRIVNSEGKDIGQAARVEQTFKPKMPIGEITVDFKDVDTSKLEGGMKLVAIHTIYDDSGVVVAHADLEDKDQTVSLISIGTKASGDINNEANASVEKVTLKDKITYKGAAEGDEYDMCTELHYQNIDDKGNITDGGIVKDKDGKEVTKITKFKADKSNGELDVPVEFAPTEDMAGKSVVFFEYLEKDGKVYASHTDITDENQTVHFPKIGTKASDSKDGDKYLGVSENEEMKDVVTLDNLTVGQEYTVEGQPHIKSIDKDGKVIDEGIAKDKDGKEAYASKTFVAEATTQKIELVFNVDTRELQGKSLVAFEKLLRKDVVLGVEADIENTDQTVTVVKLKTSLTDKATGMHTASKVMSKDGKTFKVSLKDRLSYEGLAVGEENIAKGQLMVSDEKGEAMSLKDKDGKEVISEVKFTPNKSNGFVDVTFEFELPVDTDITKMVAFETILSKDGNVIGTHHDIKDEAQTVSLVKIQTVLTGADKKAKTIKSAEKVDSIDTVSHDGTVKGEEYIMTGTLHIQGKKDGKVVDLGVLKDKNGKEIVVEKKFVAEDSKGSVEMTFTIDTSQMEDGTTLVAFEKLMQVNKETGERVLVASHEDIEDAAQSIVVEKKSTTPPTKVDASLETAVSHYATPVAIMLVMSVAGIGYLIMKRRKELM